MSTPTTTLLPFQPASMSTAQLAAVSFLARNSGRTHLLYAFQLREWFAWCERNGLDPLVGVQRAHVELYIRSLGERGLMDSSGVSMLCSVRGFFKFAHIDGADPGRPGRVRPAAEGAARRAPHPPHRRRCSAVQLCFALEAWGRWCTGMGAVRSCAAALPFSAGPPAGGCSV